MKIFKLIPLILLMAACSTTTTITESGDPSLERYPPRSSARPNNWIIEYRDNGDDTFIIARSLEVTDYMWLTCRQSSNGANALSLGVAQSDRIGFRGDDALLVFMVDGREVIFGPAIMVNTHNAGMRSYDPRFDTSINELEKTFLIETWINDESRRVQYEVIEQMFEGDFTLAEIRTGDIKRNIEVDLQGFAAVAQEVVVGCNATL